MHRLRAALAALILFAAPLAGSELAEAVIDGLSWRLIGPFRGGRVLAVAGVPGEREHFYFGSVNGGVWETLDAGRTWKPIFDEQPIASIGAIAVAPSDPKVLYVGTGEADMRSDISQGEGIFRSTDGGRSWSFAGLADSQQVGRILVHPENARVVYVAALGHPYGPNAERGVFRSRDGGGSWEKVLGPDVDTGAIDLVFEPGNPQVIYAALWQTRRTPWSIYPPSNGPGSGLYKSTDGGDHWNRLAGGFPQHVGRVGLSIGRTAPQRVYAMVDGDEGGVYRSDDAGATWRRTSDDRRVWNRGWYFGGIKVDPRDADVVLSLNTSIFRSTDGGQTFVPVKGDNTGDDFHEIWIDEDDPRRQILGVDQGAIVTLNDGATWSSWHNQPTGQFYNVSTDGSFPYWVYGAQQDSGAAGVPSRTILRNGINLTQFRESAAGGESDNVAPDPRNPRVLFGGRVDRLDLDTGQTRSVDPMLSRPEPTRRTWTLPLVFSYRDPRALYFANERLYRTTDDGESWQAMSPDLTREDPGTPANLDPVTAANHLRIGPRRGVIYAIATSRLVDDEIWVGTDDGLVWKSRDQGGHWEDVTPPELTGWSKIAGIETSPHDANTVYVAVDRHRLDDFAPYLYRTRDGGATWELVVDGIPPGRFVNAVREDRLRPGLLFAGTERGVFVSFDDGGRWRPLQTGLPVTSVRDLEVHGDDLVIATHGRAFWVLDDLSPLRQVAESGAAGGDRLFRPSTAVRLRPAGFTGTPFPKDEPAAANPPFGAFIDYFLAQPPATPLELEIRDAAGDLVRRYDSAMRPDPVDLAKLGSAPEWEESPVALESTPGFHRFVWPLRRGATPGLVEADPFADGVWVAPGEYTIELRSDGRSYRQPLVIAPDPRLDLPPSAYAKQEALARRIESERARLAVVSRQIDALDKRLAKLSSSPTKTAAWALAERGRLAEISGSGPPGAWWLPPQRRETVRFVSGVLAGLQEAVDGADAAPSPDARKGVEEVQPLVETTLALWRDFERRQLPKLERRLTAAERP